ncbi:MAG TPA: hypothetical protein PLG59_18810, partial [bacterium]|nr:hypothetical protein [bacterium]
MSQQVDLDRLESFLRKAKAEPALNGTHKANLLNQLMGEYPKREISWGVLFPACSAAIALIVAVSIFF